MNIDERTSWLLQPDRLYCWEDLERDRERPPTSPGAYGWYFDALPPFVPLHDCHRLGEWRLAYVGISPKAPPENGAAPSKQSLRQRIRNHFNGNAEGSTLRLSLGAILASELGIELRRVGSSGRRTFGPNEEVLSNWMATHARVVWLEHSTPWELETEVICRLSLPLNLAGNRDHPFHPRLTAIRRDAKEHADRLPRLE